MSFRSTLRDAINLTVDTLPIGGDFVRAHLMNSASLPQNFRDHHAMILSLQRLLEPSSNCLDIGANRGDILKHILRLAPDGVHCAFEAVPEIANQLSRDYGDYPNVTVYNVAVSDKVNTGIFYCNKEKPRIRTLSERTTLPNRGKICEIPAKVVSLDSYEFTRPIAFIKIDVEGAEKLVIAGALGLITHDHPAIIFEFHPDAQESFDSPPECIFDLFDSEIGYQILSLSGFLKGSKPLSRDEFVELGAMGTDFVGLPR